MNKLDNVLIPIGKNMFLKYSDIICILDKDQEKNEYFFKSKKVINTVQESSVIRSYIYCVGDYLISTNIEISTLKKRIDNAIKSNKDIAFSIKT